VVVGGVAAGLSAAARARRLDRELEIVVLEKGRRISYGACGLPYWFEGNVRSVDELVVYGADYFRRERNIEIRTECEVKAVRHVAREVVLANGERLHYDRLVWAGGARPAKRPADPRLHVLHTDTDAEALMADLRARRPKTAAVAGAGYIGLEMVEALRTLGLQVTLYTAGAHVLRRRDDAVTRAVVERLARSRVKVELNTRIEDPSQLSQDVIVWATGLQPNVELLADAGADLGRTGALRVSDRMETSIAGVYAAGDCCETTHLVTGRAVWMPLGTTANKMGRVAGANAAGRIERFPGIVGTSIVRVCGLAVGTVGLCAEGAKREGFQPVEAVIEARERPKYFRGRLVNVQLVADRGSRRLVGAAVWGDEGVVGRINTLAAALTARMKAEDLEHLDLAYAPPYATAMDPILIAAQQLLKKLDERGW
jgi:NADPH-dependent 2,4-dienoyl-CoA reductase/sulfur reductase-like enzyme